MEIIQEDSWFLIINKAPGESVQADKTGDPSLLAPFQEKYPDIAPLHRLDKVTSGLVILGKTKEAQKKGMALFQQGKVKKYYYALTKSIPEKRKGDLVHYLKREGRLKKTHVQNDSFPGGKKAVLRYTIQGESDSFYLWKIQLVTGRFHQIRGQLGFIGCPIKGDRKYGFQRYNKGGGIHLHSSELQWIHPFTGEEQILKGAPDLEDPLWAFFGPSL